MVASAVTVSAPVFSDETVNATAPGQSLRSRYPEESCVASTVFGRSAAAASATASAVACAFRFIRYQEPTSTAAAATPIKTTSISTNITIVCPR